MLNGTVCFVDTPDRLSEPLDHRLDSTGRATLTLSA